MTNSPTPVMECQQILVSYHGDIDRSRATAAIDHFSDDAEFEARGQRLRGRAQILEFLTHRESMTDRHTAHVVVNVVELPAAEGELTLSAMILLLSAQPGGGYELEKVLDTVHRFVQTPEGWRIAARTSGPLHALAPAR